MDEEKAAAKRAKSRARYEANRESNRRSARKKRFGGVDVPGPAMGHCKSCGDYAMLVQDHDHETGRLRDRLCNWCNTGLGMFRDDPRRLRAAARYLDRHVMDGGPGPKFVAASGLLDVDPRPSTRAWRMGLAAKILEGVAAVDRALDLGGWP